MLKTLAQADLLSPAPILDAVERYRGTIFDLDASRALSPDEFARARGAAVVALRRNGLMSGDRVIMALANGPQFVAMLTAILECEGSPLLLHWKTPAAELQRYADHFGARFAICEPSEAAQLVEITRSPVEIGFSDLSPVLWAQLDLSDASFAGPLLRGVPLHPTSGSTGLPKIALRPGYAALEEARHYAATMAIDADDTIIAIPPMSHAYGYGMCVMAPLLTGANMISMRRFSSKQFFRALEEHKITILPMAPAMLDVLSFGRGADLSRARWVLAAGAMLPKRAAEQFRAKTGAVACPLYGTTETGGISVATAADGRDLDGRVGPPMAGVAVETRLQKNEPDLGPDIGKLFIRSSSMMVGYLDQHGQISTPFDEGWFETGDLARLEHDGSIHLRGRDSEVINVSGLKVVPCEVEEAITKLPGVLEVKVYAGDHRSGTQIVKAAVATAEGLAAADVRAHCERHLVYYKRPQVVTLVEALPRTPTGKIDREQLP